MQSRSDESQVPFSQHAALIRSARSGVRRAALPLGVLVFATSLALLAGCSDPLLSPKDERSPFDRYDAVRNQHAPQYVEDKFGRRQPNLRGRLGEKD